MNMIFRLVLTWIVSRFRTQVPILGPCRTPFRCWPTDLDALMHMNNGKYFSLLDLARLDLMTRAGMVSKIAKAAWYPVVTGETMKFKKSIKLLDTFDIETSVLSWDEKAFILKQRFLKKDLVFAEAIVRARFLKKSGGSVSPKEIWALVGEEPSAPALEPWIQNWNQHQI